MQNKFFIAILAALLSATMMTSAAVNYVPITAQNDTNAAFEINEALNNASVDANNTGEVAATGEAPAGNDSAPVTEETEYFNELDLVVTVESPTIPAEEVPPSEEVVEEGPTEVPVINTTEAELPSAENITEEAPEVVPEAPVMDVPEAPVTPEEPAPTMGVPEVTPAEEQVINGSEQAGSEVVEAVPEDTQVEQAVNDTVDVIEGSVNGTVQEPEEVEEAAQNVTEAVKNATEGGDQGVQEEAETGLEKLLVGLVDAQEYNENLTEDEKTALQDNLEQAIEEI